MEYIAKRDCKYGLNSWKKGEDVKVSASIAKTMKANGDIEPKKADTKKSKGKEK